ncbi:Pseudouridine-metabolizing bifunctional protein [Sparassis crispa]|uniref:Pseudouridine-metabolizing bifunctional protein n=1 Tax=Sparassis crispa TaxID=139825 RepID=A0A401G776_9APHY|nr:Pseudouridine-metabolizing bifunctional protein [Sparassis crispa]GBE78003.1 Pseudouridine-metabolizing bifunctional protein [Sparassis crispa]
MPHPVNLETARTVEGIVREAGAIPATIGIIGGRVKIGLKARELEYLADAKAAIKISRRDIGPAIATGKDGGTTCSATLIFAALAGIKVFATGGLGGVHRGGETSMDISADLQELTRCPVGLVSAGVKSILDIGRTLEYLETLGVPVLSYAKTDDFPAFYSRRSGFKSPWKVDDPATAARILYTQRQLGMANGVVYGVPIPEEYEAIGQQLQSAVEQALKEAEQTGVNKRGKEVTPWLLKRVGELTKGKSLANNIALIKNTALIGSQIAIAYADMTRKDREDSRHLVSPAWTKNAASVRGEVAQPVEDVPLARAKLIVVGSTAVDVTAKANPTSDGSTALHTTTPGTVAVTLGGVGRNVAEAAHRILASQSEELSSATALISPIGNDSFGRLLVDEFHKSGMRTDGLLQVDDARSAVCNMVVDTDGSLVGGVADMDIINSLDTQKVIQTLEEHRPSLVAVDGNLTSEALKSLIDYCHQQQMPVFFEPTSVPKSTAVFPAIAGLLDRTNRPPITFAAPNLHELKHMYQEASSGTWELTAHKQWWTAIDDMALGSEFPRVPYHSSSPMGSRKWPFSFSRSFTI